MRRRQQAVRLVRSVAGRDGDEHGTVQRVAEQLGYGVESVRTWVKQADIDDGARPGVTTAEAERGQGARAGGPGAAPRQRDPQAASAFFAAELDRPQRR